jgi:shikimate dehydrogenase
VPAITGRTRVLFLIADPIVQARSPALANAALERRGSEAVLVALQVPRDGLRPALDALRLVGNFAGAIVSMPHKSAIVELLDELTPEAQQVGACNVIRREPDGRLIGTMLDGEGFLAGLRAAGHEIRGKRVFLAGAGGAASAIAFALARAGVAGLTIHNRTRSRAGSLMARVHAAYPAVPVALAGSSPAGHDVVVNGTSLGMQPDDPLPVEVRGLAPGMLAAEVVIAPERTAFLQEAERRGCAVHTGVPMLEGQMAAMLAFTGVLTDTLLA